MKTQTNEIKVGVTIEWQNGSICFREVVFERNGRLFVRGAFADRPIPVDVLVRNFRNIIVVPNN